MLINFFCPNDWRQVLELANKKKIKPERAKTHSYFSNEQVTCTIKKNKPKENAIIKSTPPLLKETTILNHYDAKQVKSIENMPLIRNA